MKTTKSLKTLVAVERESLYSTWNSFTRPIYCHLENKKTLIYRFLKFNNRIRDRTILKIDMDVRAGP